MPITEHQPRTQRPERPEDTELQQRYRAIGISAVAAAMGFRDDAKPSDEPSDRDSKPRAA